MGAERPGQSDTERTRRALTLALRAHLAADEAETRDLWRILEFVSRYPNPFDRRIREGHLTGSALVLSATGDRTLLVHHRKLERWLQPGGHADEDETSGETVALREAREETGIRALALHPAAPRPLDLDIHTIPPRGEEPAHEHLDLRYLVVAPEGARLSRSEHESNDLRWFGWNELAALDLDAGLRRALDKARHWIASAASLALAAALTASPAPARAEALVDHSAFDALLRVHVVNGMVDYDAFKASREFAAYLDRLARVDPAPLPEAERLAYWINVYNAYTIALINKHGERESIRNINKTVGLKLKGPWREELVRAGSRQYHLDNVEHDIIRKQFKEPRIHFALVCAAMSCPPLRSEAYVGVRLDAQLDEQARRFLLETPSQNRVDAPARVVYVSTIFEYYKEDFGGSDAAIGRYIARFHPDGPAKDLLLSGNFQLVKTPYDWTLNSQQKARLVRPPR